MDTSAPSPKFRDLSFGGKMVFAGKLVIFLMTFGFAFPLLLSD